MKTLIINGSPRRNGDTAFLLSELKRRLNGEVVELDAYRANCSPCIDCRKCREKKGCVIEDDMRLIYDDDFDNVVIASPLYMSCLTPPLMAIASRFQVYYCAKRFLKDEFHTVPKKGGLILVGGGDGSPAPAINTAEWMFKKMNAQGHREHRAFSLKTDDIPAREDAEAIEKVLEIADYFNCG